jgi:hypothetical protein
VTVEAISYNELQLSDTRLQALKQCDATVHQTSVPKGQTPHHIEKFAAMLYCRFCMGARNFLFD